MMYDVCFLKIQTIEWSTSVYFIRNVFFSYKCQFVDLLTIWILYLGPIRITEYGY